MPLPVISVIITFFNGADLLQRCLDSILCQTHQYKKVIIMDGGSTDGTVEILEDNDRDTYGFAESIIFQEELRAGKQAVIKTGFCKP